MNIFFAAVGLLLGVVTAGTAFVWRGPHVLLAVTTGGAPPPPPIPSLAAANKYQLYLFVSEFLRRSEMTRPVPEDTELSDYEFYRIVYKLVKPLAEKKQAQDQPKAA